MLPRVSARFAASCSASSVTVTSAVSRACRSRRRTLGEGGLIGEALGGRRSFAVLSRSVREVDDFGLVSHAAALLHQQHSRRGAESGIVLAGDAAGELEVLDDFQAWREVSERATTLLTSMGEPGALVWLLDLLAQADLHPTQRSKLAFPKSLREMLTEEPRRMWQLSNDELCLAWRAFERLQLMHKLTSKLFYEAVTSPWPTHDPNARRRCEGFSLQNWIWLAFGARSLQEQHPAVMSFVENLTIRLLVQRTDELMESGMQLEALEAVSRMVGLSSRQMHRVTATLKAALPRLTHAEVAQVPRVGSLASLLDEALFEAFASRFEGALVALDVPEMLTMWRALLRWKIGPLGMQRSAATMICESTLPGLAPRLSPKTALRLLRAFSRLDSRVLGIKDEGKEVVEVEGKALAGGLASVLRVLPAMLPALSSVDLVLMLNALGHLASGWWWLSPQDDEPEGAATLEPKSKQEREDDGDSEAPRFTPLLAMAEGSALLSEAVGRQLRFAGAPAKDHSWWSGDLHMYSSWNLAVLLLAHARLLRRCETLPSSPLGYEVPTELARRLAELLSTRATDDEPAELRVISVASSASSRLLAHIAAPCHWSNAIFRGPSPAVLQLADAALDCVVAAASPLSGQPEAHKAVAAASSFGVQVVKHSKVPSGLRDNATEMSPTSSLDLEAKLLEALPILIQAALSSPHAGDSDELELAVEVLDARTLDACLLSLTIVDCLHADDAKKQTTSSSSSPAVAAAATDSAAAAAGDALEAQRETLIAELCRRSAELTGRGARIVQQKLFDPLLVRGSSTPKRVCSELLSAENEAALRPSVAAVLRDCSYVVQQAERSNTPLQHALEESLEQTL